MMNELKIGDIFYQKLCSADFYQIVGITEKSVKFIHIAKEYVSRDDYNMICEVKPISDKVYEGKMSVRINGGYGSADYDGKPLIKRLSSYNSDGDYFYGKHHYESLHRYTGDIIKEDFTSTLLR